jgi:hypothetical protein
MLPPDSQQCAWVDVGVTAFDDIARLERNIEWIV